MSATDTSDTPDTAAMLATPAWVAGLEAVAPDVIACWRVFTWDLPGLRLLRRELRHRVEPELHRLLEADAEADAAEDAGADA